MDNVRDARTRGTSTRHRAAASLVVLAALLYLPAAASAAAPTATTSPPDPSLITDTYALLTGVVNPNGLTVTYHFDWGKTAVYGQTTPVISAGNGKADVPVDISLDGLEPATRYHYRLVASTAGAPDVLGADEVFKTAPALAASVIGKRVHVTSKGQALVLLHCVGPTDETCSGRLTLNGAINGKNRSLGSVAYSLAVGKKRRVHVKLSASARSALLAAPGQSLTVTASTKTSGIKKAGTKKLTLVG